MSDSGRRRWLNVNAETCAYGLQLQYAHLAERVHAARRRCLDILSIERNNRSAGTRHQTYTVNEPGGSMLQTTKSLRSSL